MGVAGFDLEDTAKVLQGVRGAGEGVLQERSQLDSNRNLLGPAGPGELGFEQPRQGLGLAQPPVDVSQCAQGIPIVGPLRQRLPVRPGGSRVVSAPAQCVADAEVPVTSLQGSLARGGRASAQLDQVVVPTRALVEIGQRLGDDAERVAILCRRRENLDGSVHVVQGARAQSGDPDPQGRLRPEPIQLLGVGFAGRLPAGSEGCEPHLENAGEIGVAFLGSELVDQELAGGGVSRIQMEDLLVMDTRPRRIVTSSETELRGPRVKYQRPIRIRCSLELGFQGVQEVPRPLLLLVEPRQGLPDIGVVGVQGGGGLQVQDGVVGIDQAIATQRPEPLSDLEVVLGRSVAEPGHQSVACGLPLAEPLQECVEPALGLCCQRGFAVGERGEQLLGLLLPVQRLFEEFRAFEIQRRSGVRVLLLGRARLDQFA
jgi:hypothetical protein